VVWRACCCLPAALPSSFGLHLELHFRAARELLKDDSEERLGARSVSLNRVALRVFCRFRFPSLSLAEHSESSRPFPSTLRKLTF
jgi:hypothetical protein